jgi:carbamoyltransferase
VNVLGIHKDPWHNSGAAVVNGDSSGTQFVMVSEERFDRVKDSRAFPEKSIAACMRECGLKSFAELDLVVTDYIVNSNWKEDFVKKPCRTDVFLADLPPGKLVIMNHHLAHAYASYFSSGYEAAAILVVDGRGSDKETQSLFVAEGMTIKLVASTTVIGIGLLYAAVTQAIGFGLLQEGKTMGLAPYGEHVKGRIFDIPRSFRGIVTDYSGACVDGNYDLKIPFQSLNKFDEKARAAFEVQKECEDAMLHLARWAKDFTGKNKLCLSGGVALNSVTNFKILEAGLFTDVFVNPGASDTGIPLGAALYGYHARLGGRRNYSEIPAFLGPSYDGNAIEEAIGSFSGFTVQRERALEHTVEMLFANKIVACHYGRSEMGPRALGNRSILMSPLLAENKDILNSRVKHRESFRPFAPVVMQEHTAEYFEMNRPCPYMLFVPPVRPQKRSVIPAVTHVDGSGRLQTLTERDNPLLYEITRRFKDRTGVPVLLNTSFNDNNEPIVESPADAIRCFLRTNIDGLLLGGSVLLLKEGG